MSQSVSHNIQLVQGHIFNVKVALRNFKTKICAQAIIFSRDGLAVDLDS